ncbi:MAG: 2-isopropylmalate synthase [Desulfovibrio sp.]|uniref:2-isopropylmalate synthase n=1 Tax=Desulfovibrio sp. 7SRBS1 TaxID=3378064 RepID=UPI003B4043A7
MSDRITIFDTTLRDGEQSPGATMNLREKVRLARQLEALGVDVIEAGFPAASQGDFESVQEIAGSVNDICVAGLARSLKSDIERAWDAIKGAKNPRIHTFIATSPLHMEFKLQKTPDQVLEMTEAAVKLATSFTSNVEFSAEDASRSEPEFLARVVEKAIACGATTINIPDTVGYSQPEEFAGLITYLLEHVPNAHKAVFSVHCHNDLGLGVANTLAALRAGARQAELTLSGIGERAGNAALEQLVMALATRKDYYDLDCNVDTTQLFPACRLLSRIIGQPIDPYKAIVGRNAFAHESGIHQDGMLKHRQTYEIMTPESVGRAGTEIVMGKHSGRTALDSKLKELGFLHLSSDEVDQVFTAIKHLADRKTTILDEDVEALVLEEVFRRHGRYSLKKLSVLSGNIDMPPTAMVILDDAENEDEPVEKRLSGFGSGPIDAVFQTVDTVVERAPNLMEYKVNAVTGGADALGEVTVRLEENGMTSVGRGSDEDIIVASAKAYINAVNRLIIKEGEKKNGTYAG